MKTTTEITAPLFRSDPELMEMIMYIVCRVADLDQANLKTSVKKRCVSNPRNLYIHFCYLYTTAGYKGVGKTINRTAQTVKEAYHSIQQRFIRKDREIYSMYLTIKHELDQFIETLYPATFDERIAHIHRVEKVDLCL